MTNTRIWPGNPILFISSSIHINANVLLYFFAFRMMPYASTWRLHRLPDPNVNWTCSPKQRIVFCKTGSTTTAALLERFGYHRNLSFAMGRSGHVLSLTKLFHHSMAFKIPNRTRQDYDFLVNHIRFNRKEMDISVPNAKYISIIRNPITQLESEFGYFEMAKTLKIATKNPFMTFISNPQKYYHMNSKMWYRRRRTDSCTIWDSIINTMRISKSSRTKFNNYPPK